MSLFFKSEDLRLTALRVLEIKLKSNGIKFKQIPGKRRIHYKIIKANREFNTVVFSADGECLKIYKCHEYIKPFFIFIWYVYENPTFYILTYNDVRRLFGPKPFETFSWKEEGYYSWSSATGVPSQRKHILDTFYKNNWGILK